MITKRTPNGEKIDFNKRYWVIELIKEIKEV